MKEKRQIIITTNRKKTTPGFMVQLEPGTHEAISKLSQQTGRSIRYLVSHILDRALEDIIVVEEDDGDE